MNLRRLLGWDSDADPVLEDPTRVGQDAFSAVAQHYDALMASVPYKSWVDYIEAILRRVGAEPRDVLDLCCGTGKVGSELARRSYRTLGVDLSEGMVRQCATRNPPLPAAVMDATALGLRAASFDLVVSLYDSLNYITDPAGLASCMVGVAHALREGGLFIFDLNTTRALRLGLFTQDNLNSREPLLYRWKSHWNEERKLCKVDMSFKWRGEGEPVEFQETHYERAYEDDEVRGMLDRAGLVTLAVYHAYAFREPTSLTNRVYYVARKTVMG